MWCLPSTIGTCRMLLALMLDAVGCIYLFFFCSIPICSWKCCRLVNFLTCFRNFNVLSNSSPETFSTYNMRKEASVNRNKKKTVLPNSQSLFVRFQVFSICNSKKKYGFPIFLAVLVLPIFLQVSCHSFSFPCFFTIMCSFPYMFPDFSHIFPCFSSPLFFPRWPTRLQFRSWALNWEPSCGATGCSHWPGFMGI